MHLKPVVSAETWLGLTRDGIKRFDNDAALYIRPMYWAERSGTLLVAPDPDSTEWCLSLYEAPMRALEGFSITVSPYCRPSMECMPVDAKAGCLYPNNARALIEANSRGSGNYSKVMPINRIDARSLQPGPLYRKARELYWAFAHD